MIGLLLGGMEPRVKTSAGKAHVIFSRYYKRKKEKSENENNNSLNFTIPSFISEVTNRGNWQLKKFTFQSEKKR